VTPLPVRTERLLLRAARPEDVDDLLAYYSDPSTTRYVPFEAVGPGDVDALRPRLERYLAGTDPQAPGDVLHAMMELDGHVVGDVMLRLTASPSEGDRPPSMAEVGWILNPAFVGRGLVTEAARAVVRLGFEHYGLRRLHATLDPRNTASSAVCDRLGMRLEAHLRQDYWCKGEWTDTAVYGLLREEWQG
jgi:RimJ/RimL family protein N-acetyltransferase